MAPVRSWNSATHIKHAPRNASTRNPTDLVRNPAKSETRVKLYFILYILLIVARETYWGIKGESTSITDLPMKYFVLNYVLCVC